MAERRSPGRPLDRIAKGTVVTCRLGQVQPAWGEGRAPASRVGYFGTGGKMGGEARRLELHPSWIRALVGPGRGAPCGFEFGSVFRCSIALPTPSWSTVGSTG